MVIISEYEEMNSEIQKDNIKSTVPQVPDSSYIEEKTFGFHECKQLQEVKTETEEHDTKSKLLIQVSNLCCEEEKLGTVHQCNILEEIKVEIEENDIKSEPLTSVPEEEEPRIVEIKVEIEKNDITPERLTPVPDLYYEEEGPGIVYQNNKLEKNKGEIEKII